MKNYNLSLMKRERSMINECADLYMDTFSKEPWFDTYESRNLNTEREFSSYDFYKKNGFEEINGLAVLAK